MLITRLVYAAYAALAVYSSFEAQKIFKGKQTDVQDGEYYYCHGASGESSCRMPVSMCLLSGDLSDIAEHCEGTGLIKNIVPVSAALSVAAVLIYRGETWPRGGGVPNPGVCTHTLYSAVYAATAHIHVSYKCIRMSHTYAFSRPPRRCGAFSEFSVLRGNTPVLPCACWA